MPGSTWDIIFPVSGILTVLSTLTVFVGLYLETPLTIRRPFSKVDFNKSVSRAIKRTDSLAKNKKIGERLVTAGVACEFLFGAIAIVATLKVDAALRLRQIKLSPRLWVLADKDVQDRIVAKLKPFAGQRVVIYETQTEDRVEIHFFAFGLAALMDGASWLNASGAPLMLTKDNAGNINFSFPTSARNGVSVYSVFVECDPNAPEKGKDAAKALAEALTAENLSAKCFLKPSGSPIEKPLAHGNVIAVTVNMRPPF